MFGTPWVTPGFAQTTYYVAAGGNDANDGRSAASPFQTLGKVNSLNLQAGDQVLFKRGDVFRGTLVVSRSGSAGQPIVYDAYGSGAKPVLAASVPVTNWTSAGNGVWQASCGSCGSRVTGLFRNGNDLPLGRYPNFDARERGYLTVQSHTGSNDQITSQQDLPGNISWIGAEIVLKPWQWIIDRATISAQNGNTLSFTNRSSGYPLQDGWGYFIQNHPATLDQTGEWYYDPGAKTIRLYDAAGNPNNQTITATVQERGADLSNVSNVTLRNLTFTESLATAVSAYNVSNLTMSSLDVTNAGEDGVFVMGIGQNVLIENSRIIGVNNNGFQIDSAYGGVVFRGNQLRRVATLPGRGKGGDGNYNGLQAFSVNGLLVENNVVDSIGYNGISFQTNTTVQRNAISNICLTKSDGGGIYAWNAWKRPMSNCHVLNNIVFNALGAPEGSFRDEYAGANGIFFDDCVENVEIANNTVFNCHGIGIFLHATSNLTLTNNTIFNSGEVQFRMYHDGGLCLLRGHVIRQNVFVSPLASQLVAQYESDRDDLPYYGQFDFNIYARPFDDNVTMRAFYYNQYGGAGGNMPLSGWQALSGQDAHSKTSPLTFPASQQPQPAYGPSGPPILASTFTGDLDGWNYWSGPYNTGRMDWDNTNKLDGGSLRLAFPTPSSAGDGFLLAQKPIGALHGGRRYRLRFDAVASGAKSVQMYLRQYQGGYWDLSARLTASLATNRQSYELTFTATADEANAVLIMQVPEDAQTVWLDNIVLQPMAPLPVDVSAFMQLAYNPTPRDSTLTLTGNYRDFRGRYYTGPVSLPAYGSLLLLRDPLPPADLRLTLRTDRSVVRLNSPVSFSLIVHNAASTGSPVGATWTCRLPPNLNVTSTSGLSYSNGMLQGKVWRLMTDTTFVFTAQPTAVGTYRTAAQITASTNAELNATPDSGTGDGEDDATAVTVRLTDATGPLYESPNPGQWPLPGVAPNQPAPDPTKTDLSLRMALSSRDPVLNDVLTCTLWLSNGGGATAGAVQLQNLLPAGLQFVGGPGWSAGGSVLTTTLTNVAPGTTVSTSFQVRAITPGRWVSQAQVSASDTPNANSTPGNGFTTGEKDTAQADLRVR